MNLLRHDPEFEARSSLYDYYGGGPEPDFGSIKAATLDEWLAACQGVALRPQELTDVGWMHIERAWSYATEQGDLGDGISPDLHMHVERDLDLASQVFEHVEHKAEAASVMAAMLGHLSLPLFRTVLT